MEFFVDYRDDEVVQLVDTELYIGDMKAGKKQTDDFVQENSLSSAQNA